MVVSVVGRTASIGACRAYGIAVMLVAKKPGAGITMLRTILGILAGIASAMVTITLVEMVARPLHPMPDGLSMTDTVGMTAYVTSAPMSMMVVVLFGWTLGAFDGALVAALIARTRRRMAAMVVGAVVVAAVIANAVLLPHPPWMTVMGIVLPLAAAYAASVLATRISRRRRTASGSAAPVG